MKLSEQQVGVFTQSLASSSPAPGGGSASALMGAQGAALLAMVCTLTLGKPACAPHHAAAETVRAEAEALRQQFLDVMERDTEAFLVVSAAYAMPKAGEAERARRSAEIQRGLALCTRTPLEMMRLARRALELAETLYGGFNENAASDLGVAVLSLSACVRGAWLNVLINLGSLKDQTLARQVREEGTGLVNSALRTADRLYRQLEESLQA